MIPTGDVEKDLDARSTHFVLSQNCPDLLGCSATISCEIVSRALVIQKIFNILRQEMRTFVDEDQGVSYYDVNWEGERSNGTITASGIYFYRLVMQAANGSRYARIRRCCYR